MLIAVESPDSAQEIRWRAWQEKGRRADRLAKKRMKVLFSIVGLTLVAVILCYVFRAKISPDSDHVQQLVGSDHVSIPIEWKSPEKTLESCSAMCERISRTALASGSDAQTARGIGMADRAGGSQRRMSRFIRSHETRLFRLRRRK